MQAGVTVKTLGGYNNPNGHSKSIYSFDWCPDLKLIASCGSERTVFVWNPHMSNPVFKLEGHASSLGMRLATAKPCVGNAFGDPPCRGLLLLPLLLLRGLAGAVTRRDRRRIPRSRPTVDVRFNKDQLITVSTDRLIKVFDVRTFNCLQTFGDNGNTNATSGRVLPSGPVRGCVPLCPGSAVPETGCCPCS